MWGSGQGWFPPNNQFTGNQQFNQQNNWSNQQPLFPGSRSSMLGPRPGFQPPTHGSQPPMPGSRPPMPGSRPPMPGSQPPMPGAQPPMPGAQPPMPGVQPPMPRAQPPMPSSRPPLPSTKPPLPGGIQPPLPGAKPPLPGAKPPLPGTKPPPPPEPPVSPAKPPLPDTNKQPPLSGSKPPTPVDKNTPATSVPSSGVLKSSFVPYSNNKSFSSDNTGRGSNNNARGGNSNSTRGGFNSGNDKLDGSNSGQAGFGTRGGGRGFSNNSSNRGTNNSFNSGAIADNSSSSFGRGANNSVTRGSNNSSNRGSINSFNRGANNSTNNGANNFLNRGANNSSNRGANNSSIRGANNSSNRGANNSSNRGANNSSNRGANNSSDRGANNSSNRGANNTSTRGANNSSNRGANNSSLANKNTDESWAGGGTENAGNFPEDEYGYDDYGYGYEGGYEGYDGYDGYGYDESYGDDGNYYEGDEYYDENYDASFQNDSKTQGTNSSPAWNSQNPKGTAKDNPNNSKQTPPPSKNQKDTSKQTPPPSKNQKDTSKKPTDKKQKDNISDENNKLNKMNLGLGAFLGSISQSSSSQSPSPKSSIQSKGPNNTSFNKGPNQGNNTGFNKGQNQGSNNTSFNKGPNQAQNNSKFGQNNTKDNTDKSFNKGPNQGQNSSNNQQKNTPATNKGKGNNPNMVPLGQRKPIAFNKADVSIDKDIKKGATPELDIARKEDKLIETVSGEDVEDVNNKKNKINFGLAGLLGQIRDSSSEPKEKSIPPQIVPQKQKGFNKNKDTSVAVRLAKLAGKPWWCQSCNTRNFNCIECVNCGQSVDDTMSLGPKPTPWQQRKIDEEKLLKAARMKPNMKLGGWSCETCNRTNIITTNICRGCNRHKPAYLKEGSGSWQCTGCYVHQHPMNTECMICAQMDYKSEDAQENFDWVLENQYQGQEDYESHEGYGEEYGPGYDQGYGEGQGYGDAEGWVNEQPATVKQAAAKEDKESVQQLAEFDKMFEVWEVNFTSWKEANKYNPDKMFVSNYVREMEEMREKLLSSRARILENLSTRQREGDKHKKMMDAWQSQKPDTVFNPDVVNEELRRQEQEKAMKAMEEMERKCVEEERLRVEAAEIAKKLVQHDSEDSDDEGKKDSFIPGLGRPAASKDILPGFGDDSNQQYKAQINQSNTQAINIENPAFRENSNTSTTSIQELQNQMRGQQDLINQLINQMKGPTPAPPPPPPHNQQEEQGGAGRASQFSQGGREEERNKPQQTNSMGIMEIMKQGLQKSKAAQQERQSQGSSEYGGSSHGNSEYGGENQKQPQQQSSGGFEALRKRLNSARSVADVLKNANIPASEPKRARMEDDDGGWSNLEGNKPEADMFERKSNMQERPFFPEWKPTAVTDYSQQTGSGSGGFSRRQEEGKFSRGEESGGDGSYWIRNERGEMEEIKSGDPNFSRRGNNDPGKQSWGNDQWGGSGGNDQWGAGGGNSQWGGSGGNNQWGGAAGNNQWGGAGGNNQWGGSNQWEGGWGNSGNQYWEEEGIAPPPQLHKEDLEMVEFKPKSFDYGHKDKEDEPRRRSRDRDDRSRSDRDRSEGRRESSRSSNRDSSRRPRDSDNSRGRGYDNYNDSYDSSFQNRSLAGNNLSGSYGALGSAPPNIRFGGGNNGGSNRFSPAPPPPPPAGKRIPLNDIILPPGRYTRPPRIVVILRGLPGSGKTYTAKMLKEKETGEGADPPRVMALDDYFESDGQYEYDEDLEESYRDCLFKSFKKNIDGGYFSFLIVDAVNNKIEHFKPFWSHAKTNGFEVYICEVEADIETCAKRNIHDKSQQEIEKLEKDWDKVPDHMNKLLMKDEKQGSSTQQTSNKPTSPEVISLGESDEESTVSGTVPQAGTTDNDEEEIDEQSHFLKASKWEILDREEKMARLDGTTMKRKDYTHQHKSIEDWLEIGDNYSRKADGKKRVRWADLEMRKEQAKVKEMGFVLGKRMYTSDSEAQREAESLLTATKIIPNRFQSEFHNPPPS